MEYSKKVMGHFLHPKNMGKMKNPDATGKAGNPICGDQLELYIKVKDNKIKEIKFRTLGCAAAIAVSSVLTEMAKGKTLDEAEKISGQDIVKELGGLPQVKFHCSLLAHEALRDAIKKYRKNLK
jgi:nitrogen fixation NifU-like protein